MRTILRIAFLALMIAAATPSTQAQERLFAIVDYMHVPDTSNEADYIALEKLWQRIHQKAVDTGTCLNWALYRVENGGRNDFVTVQLYDSASKFMDPWPGSLGKLIKDLYTPEEAAKMDKTDAIRILTRHELWEVEATAMSRGGEPAAYNIVNFMKSVPGKIEPYYQAEKEIFQKGHQVRVDGGEMKAWFFLSRAFPGGQDGEYDFVTVDAFVDKAASEKAIDMKKIEAVLSKEDLAKAAAIDRLRTTVRREVWIPVLRTTRANR